MVIFIYTPDKNPSLLLKITINVPIAQIMIEGMMHCFRNCMYDSFPPTTFTVSLPMIAVGGRASPNGQITLMPANATIGFNPIVLNKSTRGTPNTAADPYINTDSVMGRKKNRLPITRKAGSVMKDIASKPRTPVRVMI